MQAEQESSGPEEWRPVVGYEGWYEVSDLGRVRRVRAGKGARAGYVLQLALMKIGYYQVTLSKDSAKNRDRKYVHDLVAAAFIGPRPGGRQINHRDGRKARNCPDNLEYVTQAEKIRHARRIGTFPFGERNGHALLTEEDVRLIRRLYGTVPRGELARRFGVKEHTLYAIKRELNWGHLP